MKGFKESRPDEKGKTERVEPLSFVKMSPQVRASVTDKLFGVLALLSKEKSHYPLWEDAYTSVHGNLTAVTGSGSEEYSHKTFCDAADALISLRLLTRKQLDGMIAESRREAGE